MRKFTFSESVPEPIRNELWKHIAPYEWLVPGWCQNVDIYWDDKDYANKEKDGDRADSCCSYRYRYANVTFYPAFLSYDEPDRHKVVIHELLHTFSCVLFDYALGTIKKLMPEDNESKFRAMAIEELNARHEAWTQDMAYCIQQRLNEKKL